MAAFLLDNIYHVGLVPQRIDNNLGLLNATLDIVLLQVSNTLVGDRLTSCRVAPFNDIDLNSSLAPVEHTAVTLPWRICIVFNGDALSKAVSITDVPVLMLSLKIKLLQLRILVDVNRERVRLGCLIVEITLSQIGLPAPLRVFLSVESQISQAVHQFRLSVQPEMNKIKVVDGFVHLNAPTGLLVPVPATHEI
uniref:Uncharacterized protein n=1 Tax=Bionectria ochroleuca TaxID=29856 RepID=A0A0B7KG17_BIOOC